MADCPSVCCLALHASCLACEACMDIWDFCLSSPTTDGCQDLISPPSPQFGERSFPPSPSYPMAEVGDEVSPPSQPTSQTSSVGQTAVIALAIGLAVLSCTLICLCAIIFCREVLGLKSVSVKLWPQIVVQCHGRRARKQRTSTAALVSAAPAESVNARQASAGETVIVSIPTAAAGDDQLASEIPMAAPSLDRSKSDQSPKTLEHSENSVENRLTT
eukprot:6209344-Pleurochrysis_carterae.AAC.3